MSHATAPSTSPSERPARLRALVLAAIALGPALGVAGLVAGIKVATADVSLSCEGQYDTYCYDLQPDVAEGVAIAILSVMLAIVILLCGVIALRALGPQTRRDRSHLLQQ